MLSLNIISPDTKNEIKLKNIFKLINQVCYLLIIITLSIAIVLFVAKIILQNYFLTIAESTTLVTKNIESYDIKIDTINSRLNFVSDIQNEYMTFSPYLEELMSIIDKNIKFTSINISKNDQIIKFTGNAKTRDSLLLLKDYLEKSKFFNEVDLPIANILQKENINFNISAKLNFYEN